MPKKSGSSIKTMVIISSKINKLSFWPRPFEVKQVAKMGEKCGKIRKIEYFHYIFEKISVGHA
jgi:hypothetical protein